MNKLKRVWGELHASLWFVPGLIVLFLARLPYLVIALVVFGVFLIVARVVEQVIHVAGTNTRLDVTLADLLGRLASAAITALGLFVAAGLPEEC